MSPLGTCHGVAVCGHRFKADSNSNNGISIRVLYLVSNLTKLAISYAPKAETISIRMGFNGAKAWRYDFCFLQRRISADQKDYYESQNMQTSFFYTLTQIIQGIQCRCRSCRECIAELSDTIIRVTSSASNEQQ